MIGICWFDKYQVNIGENSNNNCDNFVIYYG